MSCAQVKDGKAKDCDLADRGATIFHSVDLEEENKEVVDSVAERRSQLATMLEGFRVQNKKELDQFGTLSTDKRGNSSFQMGSNQRESS